MVAQVAALKPKKRKTWKSTLTDARGQNTRVRYVEDGIKLPGRKFVSHFQNKLSGEKPAQYGIDDEWRTVIPMGLPTVDIEDAHVVHLRRERDVARYSMSSREQCMDIALEVVGNHTGNHEPQNHRISIPTRAAEPVRG